MVKEYLTLTEAAFMNHSTRTNIFKAIKTKKLKAKMIKGAYQIQERDLDEYKENRWSRSKSRLPDGSMIFDKGHQEYSVVEAAKMLRVKTHHIYYAIRQKRIPFVQKGGYIVLKEKDLQNYRDLPYLAVKAANC